MGELDGDNAGAVRDLVAAQIKAAFAALRLKSEIFVTVGGNWAWGSRTT